MKGQENINAAHERISFSVRVGGAEWLEGQNSLQFRWCLPPSPPPLPPNFPLRTSQLPSQVAGKAVQLVSERPWPCFIFCFSSYERKIILAVDQNISKTHFGTFWADSGRYPMHSDSVLEVFFKRPFAGSPGYRSGFDTPRRYLTF